MSSRPPRKRGPRKLPGARFLPARLGPKAAEDEEEDGQAVRGGGLTLRAMLPNAITAAASESSSVAGSRCAISSNTGRWLR